MSKDTTSSRLFSIASFLLVAGLSFLSCPEKSSQKNVLHSTTTKKQKKSTIPPKRSETCQDSSLLPSKQAQCGELLAEKPKQAKPKTTDPSFPFSKTIWKKKVSKKIIAYFKKKQSQKIEIDLPIDQMVQPFREQLEQRMSRVIGMVPMTYLRRKPESNLGNLVSESALAFLRKNKWKIDVFITNLGGIRRDLAAGTVALRDIYEILPFENQVVLFSLTGKEVKEVVRGLVKRNGEPFAGMRFSYNSESKKIEQLTIQKKPVLDKKKYVFGSTQYVVQTGWLSAYLPLKSPLFRMQLAPYMLRDVLIWGVAQEEVLKKSDIDDRIFIE